MGGGGGGVGIRLGARALHRGDVTGAPEQWGSRQWSSWQRREGGKDGRGDRYETGRPARRQPALQLGGLLRGEAPLRGLTAATEEET